MDDERKSMVGMSAMLLDGRELAARLRARLTTEAARVADERGRPANLTLVGVGEDATARLYAEQVARSARRVGMECVWRALPATTTETALRMEIAALGARADVDGVALLLPLPARMRQRVVMEVLPPEKDVDGLGPRNAGHLMLGFPSFVPSTADAALELLRDAGIALQGRSAVVVGRSNVGGKPAALLFLRENATVTLCHSRTPDLPAMTRQADILFTSVGRANCITAEMVKPGAVVLDAGMNAVDGRLVGDVAFDAVRAVAGYLSPVPGGLGPLTNLMLIRHTLVGPS
ncbi:MAG: bifunctional 5,10-methylenetetrahydrofolate dehydrogenase/5,10-methenyltetrahydrofolate cyclohydrolase [Ktedonobacterales bacterium]|nr:bifunctional 5,10-methylenetetrahydrofolate dehydrogenase/5,10-methenyltetrahydrofolate cyclohydrolase [Ktedonobacterales bacterium]